MLPIAASSQSIYPKILNDSLVVITAKQLKATNLIFLEHGKFKAENEQLNKQIINYNKLIVNYQATDSIKTIELKEFGKTAADLNKENMQQTIQIDKLKAKNKVWRKWTVGGFALSIALFGLLLVK